jgi:hypothetical protein
MFFIYLKIWYNLTPFSFKFNYFADKLMEKDFY